MNRRTASTGLFMFFLGLATTEVAADASTIAFISTWGSEGDKPGEFHFPLGIVINAADGVFVIAPHGVAVNSHGDLYVADAYNRRVQRFSVK